jgi:hypothetical protein
VCGVFCLAFGTFLLWWADLDRVEEGQLKTTIQAMDEWKKHHYDAWMQSKVRESWIHDTVVNR